MPQALGSSGGQVGTGIDATTREETTLFWVEAEEIWVVAAAPVRTRGKTKARTMDVMEWPLLAEIISGNVLKIKGLNASETTGPEPCRRHWDRLAGRSELGSMRRRGRQQPCFGSKRRRSGLWWLHR